MARKQFDLIVFDWDGTLMDSTATIVKCIQSAAKDLGLSVPSDAAAAHVIGLGLAEAMQTVMPDIDPALYPRMVERYRYHFLTKDHELVLFKGVPAMLEELSQLGYFLAVATGKQPAIENGVVLGSGQVRVFAVEHQPVCALAYGQTCYRLAHRLGAASQGRVVQCAPDHGLIAAIQPVAALVTQALAVFQPAQLFDHTQ